MESKLSNDFYNLTAKLMMAQERREIMNIVGDFLSTIDKLAEAEKNGSGNGLKTKVKAESYFLKFTQKEISRMATTFKKEFIANGLATHVIKRESGKNSYCYEIRYRSNGYNITASSTDLAEAKRKFLEKTTPENIGKYYQGPLDWTYYNTPTNFKDFALFYFEKFRKRKVAERTYKNDLNRLNNHILPVFGRLETKKIAPQSCQILLDNLVEQEKVKTAVEVYNLLSCIFKSAIAHSIIDKNPLATVIKPTYEQEHGIALTKVEEKALFLKITEPAYAVGIALALFCGLRPNEITNKTHPPQIHGDFIKAINSKRHKKDKQDVEYKYIPITEKLKPFLINGIPQFPSDNELRKCLKEILPNHKLYDCRTTFYSRCKECKVDQRALDEYMGHSLGKLGNAYTDLPLDFLWEEGKKIRY